MKTFLPCVCLLLHFSVFSQITSPVIRAGFGVDADLRANYFNNFLQSGNDDWFVSGTGGTGQFIIDTIGAASMMANWLINPEARKLPFYRTMRLPQFSIVNNRLWIDAVYIRDYNGSAGGDSTAFVTSNKNGDSPGVWDGGITSVLAKNDIAEMMIHVRREGPSKTDSLWFMGGLSLQGTTGNRYFDFELYQTDIFYNRATGSFTNYGPDAGHTSWEFDQAGNIIKPGDVIFSAEYSSSSLTMVEARIWVHESALNITPSGFLWSGAFDGAGNGSSYGYASIRPNSVGAYYTGLQSGNNTWAGPFGFINSGNSVVSTYSSRQFMEFSVNLTKLGLDPITLLGGDACGLPFRRILVKTRSSTSFTSELKDFIGPFDFFQTPPVEAIADVPYYCGVIGVSELTVTNPTTASVYTWTTTNGNIVSDPNAANITVNSPGTYIVTQQLLDGCSSHASDTIVITYDSHCVPMDHRVSGLKGHIEDDQTHLTWQSHAVDETEFFDVQRSLNGKNFETRGRIYGNAEGGNYQLFNFSDDIASLDGGQVFYRLRIKMNAGNVVYSPVIRLNMERTEPQLVLYPNPASQDLKISYFANNSGLSRINIYSASGALVHAVSHQMIPGINQHKLNISHLQPGLYILNISTGNRTEYKKFLVAGNAADH